MSYLRHYFSIFFIFYLGCSSLHSQFKENTQINGISMVASRNAITQNHAKAIVHLNSNFVSVMPYAFMPKLSQPELVFDTNKQWVGETMSGIEADIETLQAQKLGVMLKPHIWVWNGDFTGDIKMFSEEDWIQFEDNYKKYILAFAHLAESMGVKLFCIGTELNSFVNQRPVFWCSLIDEVKSVYSGDLTYAENWDTYTEVHFWDSLDFIGIDAYFPISNSKTPGFEEAFLKWEILKEDLKAYSKDFQTRVLFTEYGYRSIDFAGEKPWVSKRVEDKSNENAQLNLLKALHQSLWKEDWFAGGFLWKWFPYYNSKSDRHRNRFSIQGKKSEAYLKEFYADH
jgi:hypothetical protein